MFGFGRFLMCLILMAGTLQAAEPARLYDCDITQRDKGVDWISPKLAVIFQASGQVRVSDGVILAFVEQPVPAKLVKRGKKLIVRWNLSGITDRASQNIPKFFYEATIDTRDNSVYLLAKPIGFPQRWSGRGKCTVRTG